MGWGVGMLTEGTAMSPGREKRGGMEVPCDSTERGAGSEVSPVWSGRAQPAARGPRAAQDGFGPVKGMRAAVSGHLSGLTYHLLRPTLGGEAERQGHVTWQVPGRGCEGTAGCLLPCPTPGCLSPLHTLPRGADVTTLPWFLWG